MHKLVLASSLLFSGISTLKIAVLNDIHYDPNYNRSCSFIQCLDLGYYEEDSPIGLLDAMLDDLTLNYNTNG